MKITNEKLEISPTQVISWADVYELHYSKERVTVKLAGDESIELEEMPPFMVDRLFREYENYLNRHKR